MSEQHENAGNRKRKKKRSYMQTAKKLARQRGHHGNHGLDESTYQYLIHILEVTRADGFASLEDKTAYADNIYQETTGHEIDYARNPIGSRVMDSLLRYVSLEVIQRLVAAFKPSLRLLSCDTYASHVLQKLIIVCADKGNVVTAASTSTESQAPDNATVDVKSSEIYNDIVLNLSNYYLNNMEEFAFDIYANHVLRTVIKCLAGLIEDSDNSDRGKNVARAESALHRRPVAQEYTDLLKKKCDWLHKWPQFLEFGRNEVTSGLTQCVLLALKDVDSELTTAIVQKIMTGCFKPAEDGKLSSIFDSQCSIRLLETCLAVVTSKSFKKLHETFFAGNLKHLCLMQSTNFSVQRLLDHCSVKKDLEEIFDEMSEHFADIFKMSFTGILVSAANACLRLQTRQGAFVNVMLELLECASPVEKQTLLVPYAMILRHPARPKATTNDGEPPINLHGSFMIQAMLNFNKPIKIVNSLLSMDKELLRLLGDPKGSHILDAFMDSKYIGAKSREKLYNKLHGSWAELARSTHGSRCVDKIWAWASKNQKTFIMQELAEAGELLRSTKSGKIIAAKLNVQLFTINKTDWWQSQEKEKKARQLYADIIDGR